MSLHHYLLMHPTICMFIGTMNQGTWFGGRNKPFVFFYKNVVI
jgi:hypothetical protein